MSHVIASFVISELEGADGNNNNNGGNYQYGSSSSSNNGVDMYRQYWVGPSCADDGKTINMAVFMDAGCSTKAGSGVYEAFNYGNSLPYSSEAIVKTNECISCERVDEDQNQNNGNNQNQNGNGQNQNYNGNYNYNQNYEINELCQQTYEMSAKCETNLDAGNYWYADTSGCDYINNILPKLEKATRKISTGTSSSSGGASTAFAVVFFLTSCVLGAYAFFLYRKIHRAKVNLSHSEGVSMA